MTPSLSVLLPILLAAQAAPPTCDLTDKNPFAEGSSPERYTWKARDNRCEGVYVWKASGGGLTLTSATRGPRAPVPDDGPLFLLASLPADTCIRTLQATHLFGTSHLYEMLANKPECTGSSFTYTWSNPLFPTLPRERKHHPVHPLSVDELDLLALLPDSSLRVFEVAPLTVAASPDAVPSGPYHFVLTPVTDVERLSWTVTGPGSAEPQACPAEGVPALPCPQSATEASTSAPLEVRWDPGSAPGGTYILQLDGVRPGRGDLKQHLDPTKVKFTHPGEDQDSP